MTISVGIAIGSSCATMFHSYDIFIYNTQLWNQDEERTLSYRISGCFTCSLSSFSASPRYRTCRLFAAREQEVETSSDGLNSEFTAEADIPEGDDAVGSAFGYGLLTDQGTDAVIVTTTHSGVLDSETQNGDATDLIWQPGDVEINDETAELTEMPISFNGTNALTNASMMSSPGNNVDNAVPFNLIPVFEGESLQAVCINDISPFTPELT